MQKRELLLSSSKKSIDKQSSSPSRLVDLMERVASTGIRFNTAGRTLRLIEQPSGGHFKDDPHTLLRNLENRSEINRAEVELMSQRKPKHYSTRPHHPQPTLPHQDTYLTIYRRLQNELPPRKKQDTELSSEEEWAESEAMNGVRHFSQLKHHPRLLQYTLDRLKNKEQQQQGRKVEEKQEIKSASNPNSLLHHELFQDIIQQQKARPHPLQTPNAIVDNQLTKFYSKSSKGKLQVRVKEKPRCIRLLQRQEEIVCSLQGRSVSKENMKKLKQRLNVILNQIASTDNNTSPEKLPRITQQK